MTRKLPYGCSTAKILRRRTCAGFVLTETLYTPHLKLPAHVHEHACFSFVLRGGFTESYGKKTRSCLPSSVIYLPPGDVHSDNFDGTGARCLHIELKAEVVERLREHSVLLKDSLVFRDKALSYLTAKLCHELTRPDSISTLAAEALALELVVESSRHTATAVSRDSQHRIERAREFIHAHFTEPLTLAGIAESIGAHPVYLAREYHRHYHCTVGEYIRRLRIEYACRQLADSKDSLAGIALSAGFCDQSHFSRTFKLLTSISPAKYRRTCRAG